MAVGKNVLLCIIFLLLLGCRVSSPEEFDELRTAKTNSSFSVEAEYRFDVCRSGGVGQKKKMMKLRIDEVSIIAPKEEREIQHRSIIENERDIID